jgi:hypothetical protein
MVGMLRGRVRRTVQLRVCVPDDEGKAALWGTAGVQRLVVHRVDVPPPGGADQPRHPLEEGARTRCGFGGSVVSALVTQE